MPRPHAPRRSALLPLAAVPLALAVLAGCGDDEPVDRDRPSAGPTTSSSSATASEASGSPGSSASATTAPDAVAVPVYYVGDTPGGDALFREFLQVSGVEPLVAAGAALAAGDPVDPDYRSLWPSGRFASIEREGNSIVVGLADDGWAGRGSLTHAQASLALQQLAYTLQGVVGDRLPVRFELDERPVDRVLGVDVSGGLEAAPQLDVLALVSVTEPAEGAAVADTFVASGRASSFEATVPWTILDADGEVVLQGFATAEGWIDRLYPWETEVDVSGLAPGTYTFVAATDDPSSGEGGGPTEDSRTITVS